MQPNVAFNIPSSVIEGSRYIHVLVALQLVGKLCNTPSHILERNVMRSRIGHGRKQGSCKHKQGTRKRQF